MFQTVEGGWERRFERSIRRHHICPEGPQRKRKAGGQESHHSPGFIRLTTNYILWNDKMVLELASKNTIICQEMTMIKGVLLA